MKKISIKKCDTGYCAVCEGSQITECVPKAKLHEAIEKAIKQPLEKKSEPEVSKPAKKSKKKSTIAS